MIFRRGNEQPRIELHAERPPRANAQIREIEPSEKINKTKNRGWIKKIERVEERKEESDTEINRYIRRRRRRKSTQNSRVSPKT